MDLRDITKGAGSSVGRSVHQSLVTVNKSNSRILDGDKVDINISLHKKAKSPIVAK